MGESEEARTQLAKSVNVNGDMLNCGLPAVDVQPAVNPTQNPTNDHS